MYRHKPFPLRVKHFADEPAHALLIRTAAHNGTARFSPVFKRCGVLFGRSVQLVDSGLVAHLCGADPEAVLAASAVRTAEGAEVLGQTLRDEHLGGWWRRWCPSCLAEEPYHRVWWDISFLTSCPIHNVELVSDCGCGPLIHGRQGITRCNLNHDLTKADARPVEPALLAAERYVVDRLLGRGEHPHALLDKTSLGQAMQVMERIGVSILAEDAKIEDARQLVGVRSLMLAGFEALSDFPTSFNKVLDNLISRRGEQDLKNEAGAYGRLRYWMGAQIAKDKRSDLVAELRAAMTRHAKQNAISRKRMASSLGAVSGIALRTAAERCGLTPELFVRMFRLAGMELNDADRRKMTLIAPEKLKHFTEWLFSLHSMEQMVKAIGVRRQRVIDLADAGHLPFVCRPYERSEPAGKRGQKPTTRLRDRDWNTWYFEPEAAAKFLSALRTKVMHDDDRLDDELVELTSATQMFTSFSKVIELVLDGSLPLRGIDRSQPGLRGLLVSKPEAQQILKLERRQGHPLRAAAPLMGLTYNQMRSCIITKLIETVGEGTTLAITDETISEFNSTYVRAKEVAEVWGLKDSRLVIRYLREHGVEPIEVEGVLEVTLYMRDQAIPVAQSLPKPMVFKSSRDRIRYQKENDLPVEATRKSYDVPPDWNKRSNDRSGKKASPAS